MHLIFPKKMEDSMRWLKFKLLPRTLFFRTMLLIFIPLIVVQVVSIIAFFDGSWGRVGKRLSTNLTSNMAFAIRLTEEAPDNLPEIKNLTSQIFDMEFEYYPNAEKHKIMREAKEQNKLVTGFLEDALKAQFPEAITSIYMGGGSPDLVVFVDTEDGKWFFVTHHGTGDFDGRVLSVVPVCWKEGWPHIGQDIDHDGVGEMVWELPKPISREAAEFIQTSDDFNGDRLGHQWEFNHQPRQEKWSLSERKGYLRLYAFDQLREGDFFSTGNIVSQRYIRWGRGEAVAKLDINKMDNGQEAGLVHFNGGKDYAYLAVVRDDGCLFLVYRSKNSKEPEQVLLLTSLPGGQCSLWLKTEIDFSGRAVFYWSLNGHKYHACGVSFQLKWGNYRGSRIGLFTYNNLQENGYIDVD